jgi:hypothetical protein
MERRSFMNLTRNVSEAVHEYSPADYSPGQTREFARALGWFSIGLGLAEIAAPRTVSRLAGMRHHPVMLPLFGVREMAAGIGILSRPSRPEWMWARVAGDVLDLAALGYEMANSRRSRNRLAAATAAVAAVTTMDVKISSDLSHALS